MIACESFPSVRVGAVRAMAWAEAIEESEFGGCRFRAKCGGGEIESVHLCILLALMRNQPRQRELTIHRRLSEMAHTRRKNWRKA
jgi:hypothetical protein